MALCGTSKSFARSGSGVMPAAGRLLSAFGCLLFDYFKAGSESQPIEKWALSVRVKNALICPCRLRKKSTYSMAFSPML